jgi:hypothetical protein
MGEEAFADLAAQLRADPPEALAALRPEELADLTDAIRDARRRQAADLQAAGDKAYGHIPRLLRGPIRKIVG